MFNVEIEYCDQFHEGSQADFLPDYYNRGTVVAIVFASVRTFDAFVSAEGLQCQLVPS